MWVFPAVRLDDGLAFIPEPSADALLEFSIRERGGLGIIDPIDELIQIGADQQGHMGRHRGRRRIEGLIGKNLAIDGRSPTHGPR